VPDRRCRALFKRRPGRPALLSSQRAVLGVGTSRVRFVCRTCSPTGRASAVAFTVYDGAHFRVKVVDVVAGRVQAPRGSAAATRRGRRASAPARARSALRRSARRSPSASGSTPPHRCGQCTTIPYGPRGAVNPVPGGALSSGYPEPRVAVSARERLGGTRPARGVSCRRSRMRSSSRTGAATSSSRYPSSRLRHAGLSDVARAGVVPTGQPPLPTRAVPNINVRRRTS
jgi:hypothetical protein